MFDFGCGSLVPIRMTRAATIGLYRYSPDRSARMLTQTNSGYAMNLTVAGKWRYRYGRREHVLTPGAVTVGMPDVQYACAHFRRQPNANFILTLDPSAVDSEVDPLFKSSVIAVDDAIGYVMRAAACFDNEEFDSIMCELFDLASIRSYEGGRRDLRIGMRVQRMLRFIELHIAEPITLSDIASEVGLSPYTALRQFKASTGETPHECITRLRVDAAKALLGKERVSIEEISRRVGFTTHAYFCRTFKRHTGLTPSAYRSIEQRA